MTALKPAPFRRSKLANRGSGAEDDVKSFLETWEAASTTREAHRMVDTKAAGRVIKAAAADFEFFCADGLEAFHGLIEVKETEHDYRLDKKRLTQFARLRKRSKCGGCVFVVVYHSTIKRWRCMTEKDLGDISIKGSWDLRELPTFLTVAQALQNANEIWAV